MIDRILVEQKNEAYSSYLHPDASHIRRLFNASDNASNTITAWCTHPRNTRRDGCDIRIQFDMY